MVRGSSLCASAPQEISPVVGSTRHVPMRRTVWSPNVILVVAPSIRMPRDGPDPPGRDKLDTLPICDPDHQFRPDGVRFQDLRCAVRPCGTWRWNVQPIEIPRPASGGARPEKSFRKSSDAPEDFRGRGARNRFGYSL